MYTFRQWHISDRMMIGILNYTEHHIPTGDFLTAVISNDLTGACFRADDNNLENLPAFVAYFYNEAPSTCWGSEDKRLRWIESIQNCERLTPCKRIE